MILSLELTPEEETRLVRAAQSQGMELVQYARRRLGLEQPANMPPSVDEWDAALNELSQDVDPAIPPLSDEALSRQSIYGHRA